MRFNATLCEDLGHDVEDMEFTHDGLLIKCFVIIVCSHVTQMFNELKDVVGRSFKKSEVETATRLFNYLGKSFRASDYSWARFNLQKIARQIMDDTNKYDIVITPITSQAPPNIGELRPNRQAK